jgi:hypothetical protein
MVRRAEAADKEGKVDVAAAFKEEAKAWGGNPNGDRPKVRAAARRHMPLDGADCQAMEGALQQVEKELSVAKVDLDRLRAALRPFADAGHPAHFDGRRGGAGECPRDRILFTVIACFGEYDIRVADMVAAHEALRGRS